MSDLKPNSLAVRAPHLRGEWSSKNLVAFEDVSYGSNIPRIWECAAGHPYEATPKHKVLHPGPVRGLACPCNSLATKAPWLEKEWHSSNTKKFHEVSYGEGQKYNWECAQRHVYPASPSDRTRTDKPRGCPWCSGNLVSDCNSLATKAPWLEKEWHSSNTKKFHEVSYRSGELYNWVCADLHIWPARPCNRTRPKDPSGCPHCPRTPLVDKAPWLEKEWHPDNTEKFCDVSAGSTEHKKWICADKHVWSATPANRSKKTNPSGCPRCANHHSKGEVALYSAVLERHQDTVSGIRGILPSKGLELDIYVPSLHKAVEYDGSYWHSRPDAQEKDRRKEQQCAQIGIQLLRILDKEYKADREGTIKRVLEWLAIP